MVCAKSESKGAGTPSLYSRKTERDLAKYFGRSKTAIHDLLKMILNTLISQKKNGRRSDGHTKISFNRGDSDSTNSFHRTTPKSIKGHPGSSIAAYKELAGVQVGHAMMLPTS
ncbi:MAG: hypothetical protein PHY93_21140 [Bacteriovorax sp.]|nr:hypothetical protein [Bacteriovorax sp.]